MSALAKIVRPLDLAAAHIARGAHTSAQSEMCAMEMVAYMAGEPWSDAPQPASRAITAFVASWNDAMNDTDRQMLKPVLPLIIGTRTTDADEETRAWLATDWLCRVQTPAWLRLAGLAEHAEAIEGLARIADATTASLAQPALDRARTASAAARAAAWDAASAAESAATWDAARAAARDAAWDAAWAAASAAESAAARADAWAAARDAAWDAAWAAASGTLRPTVEQLQASALDLVRAMCAVGREPAEVAA